MVGAGIAGLAAAWELATNADLSLASGGGVRSGPPRVLVLEADDRVGGKLAATEFAGRTVDLAADAFLGRRPEATELCEELGISDQLVPVGASGASILARGRLRPMPGGLALGVPTRWWPMARSGLLNPAQSLRVARDLVMPHLTPEGVIGDQTVAGIVGPRLGRRVVERLVDPLIGGINAGGVDELSAAATFPALIAASHQSGSLMRALGRLPRPDAEEPVFWSLRQSTASLADRLVDRLVDPASKREVSIHTGVSVDAITQLSVSPSAQRRWWLTLSGTGAKALTGEATSGAEPSAPARLEEGLAVDGIVLALPAPRAAVLLAPQSPVAAGVLSTVEYASVGVVTLAIPRAAIGARLDGTGFLVPRTSLIADRPALITGCTYLSRKWPHLGAPETGNGTGTGSDGSGTELVRLSVGRFGDERHLDLDDGELTAATFSELARVLDIAGDPSDSLVTRWSGAFPQYRVGHLTRIGNIEKAVADLPALAVAGAAYRGVGIPACIGSGRSAARSVLGSLSGAVR
ncbi:MAG TPA: protoporphyrinogen oxidase [Acidimicrobiales bacterium]|nr:protoporphyrinogen oxidase [Acidimicrobiales bacterium]